MRNVKASSEARGSDLRSEDRAGNSTVILVVASSFDEMLVPDRHCNVKISQIKNCTTEETVTLNQANVSLN